jgi:hypothetical protein
MIVRMTHSNINVFIAAAATDLCLFACQELPTPCNSWRRECVRWRHYLLNADLQLIQTNSASIGNNLDKRKASLGATVPSGSTAVPKAFYPKFKCARAWLEDLHHVGEQTSHEGRQLSTIEFTMCMPGVFVDRPVQAFIAIA